MSLNALFQPFDLRGVQLRNRIVMAPMTRSFSPNGVPGADVAAYYRRRAEGGTGLIVTEGTYIAHPSSGFDTRVPRLYGEESLAGWRTVVEGVHAAAGKIFAQLWHVGFVHGGVYGDPPAGVRPLGPSGIGESGKREGEPMSKEEIEAVIRGFGDAAANAKSVGFDGVEIHGAHGYLIDQFFWAETNKRSQPYGGNLVSRARFAVEIVREVRQRVGPDFPVALRFSQWKLQDFKARLAHTPAELEEFLGPLSNAGVDIFHCSQRRFWEPEFPGSNLNLAGWTKKLSGKPTITVGSVALDQDFLTSFRTDERASLTGMDELVRRLESGEFDLVAIGRSLIANPDWPRLVESGRSSELQPFHRSALTRLV